jgi:hypothetical protein
MKGILAIDPGNSTGVAWGIFDETAQTVADAMRQRLDSASTTVSGDELTQAQEIFRLWALFKERCVNYRLLDPSNVELVIEEFNLIPGLHAGGADGISPARIGWAFEGYRLGRANKYHRKKHVSKAIWQPASAMRYKKQLRSWDAWVRGKDHERSAYCHIGARLMTLFKQPR